MIKLGKEAVAIASRTECKTAERIEALGEVPSHAAETATWPDGDRLET